MKPNRLLAIAALALASGTACAYEIIESRYRVEIAPGKFQDQLVLKCDNGRTVTVPWDAKLYEACGEDLVARPARAGNTDEVAQDRQKEVMMSRVREQYGNIDERYVQFQSGPAGVSMQFQGPIRDILKRYEICRKQNKNSPACVAERDQAMAALASPEANAAAQPSAQAAVAAAAAPEAKPALETKPAAKSKKSAGKPKPQTQAKTPAKPDAPAEEPAAPGKHVAETAPAQPPSKPAAGPAAPAEPAAAVAAVEAAPAKPMPQPVAMEAPAATPPSEAQLSAEQKIAQDYAWCMRAKPKFECEQARARAQAALAKPKAAKPTAKSKGGTGEAVPVKAVYQQPVSQ
jgi:hypothetical protein